LDRAFNCFDEFSNSKSIFFPEENISEPNVKNFLDEIKTKFSYINDFLQNFKTGDNNMGRFYMYINQEIFERIELFFRRYQNNVLHLKFEKENLHKSYRSEISLLRSSIVDHQISLSSKIKEQNRMDCTNLAKKINKKEKLIEQLKNVLKTDFKKVLNFGNWGFDILLDVQRGNQDLNFRMKNKFSKFTSIYKKWKQLYSQSKSKMIFLDSITSDTV
jgi:hypothetical protein